MAYFLINEYSRVQTMLRSGVFISYENECVKYYTHINSYSYSKHNWRVHGVPNLL